MNYKIVLILLLLSLCNWFFEILKWQNVISVIKKISFQEALKQSLSALTVSLLTPNRVGDYGAKAIFFSKEYQKKVVFLNVISNVSQLFVTVVFGAIGVLYFIKRYTVTLPILEFNIKIYGVLFMFIFLIITFLNKIKLLYRKVLLFVTKIPKPIFTKTLMYATIRYLIFSHQLYYLLSLFGVEFHYFDTMRLIFAMYLIASIIPSLSLFDWIIKGSVAVFVFQFTTLNELTILSITTLMWLLNFALPSVIGSYFVLNFKYKQSP